MRLADCLAPSRVLVPLGATTLDAARSTLLERLVMSGAIADLERLRSRVAEERGEDMVAIADRAFLLHYRTDTASALQAAIGVDQQGIRRVLDDGTEQRAPVVVIVVGPPRLAARQLQVVRAFSRLLPKQEVIESLLDSPSPEAVATLSVFTEYAIPEQLLVRDLMTERPRTTTGDVSLRRAARELIQTGLGALPVVDDDQRLLGMLSERELMRHLLTTRTAAGAGSTGQEDRARRHDPAGVVRCTGAVRRRSGGVDEQQGRRTRARGSRRKTRWLPHPR
jgi:CBS domain-containing protein